MIYSVLGSSGVDQCARFAGNCPLGRLRNQDTRQDHEQERPQPVGQEANVVASGAEDGFDRIAGGACEVVSFQMSVVLEVADDRLDPVSSAHLSSDGG